MKRLSLAAVVIGAMLALPADASAHPLGNFTINRYSLIELERAHVRVTHVVDMAEIPTFQELGGTPDLAAAQRYLDKNLAGWVSRLELEVNGEPVVLSADADAVKAMLRDGQGGLAILRVEVVLRGTLAGEGPFAATYTDSSFGDRLGWKEIVVQPGDDVVLTRSNAPTADASDMLRRYPDELLSSPLDVRSASFGFEYGEGESVEVAASSRGEAEVGTSASGFTSLVERDHLTPGFVLLALAVAMFWGALHALSPGHGKSLVAAYLVGSRGTARHAVFLGATVTITHTAGVFALGVVALAMAGTVAPEDIYPWLALASGLLVVGVGVGILGRRLQARITGHAHGHHHHHHHGHSHVPPTGEDRLSLRSLLALGISGGLVPCPSALVVMLGAIALDRTAFGLVLVLAFSLGLAATLTAVGLLVLYARRFVERVPTSGRLLSLLPIASAGIVTVLGVALTLRAFGEFVGSAPAAAGAAAAAAGAVMALWLAMTLVSARRHGRDHHHHPHTHDHSTESVAT